MGRFGQCCWLAWSHWAVWPSANVVNLDQIADALSGGDIRTLVEFPRDEALIERRRWNPVVSREPPFFLSWTGEQLDMPTRGLVSRAMGVASRIRTAC